MLCNENNIDFVFPSEPSSKVGDVVMGDVDNLDDDLADLDLRPRVTSATINKSQHNSKPIDIKTAVVSKIINGWL